MLLTKGERGAVTFERGFGWIYPAIWAFEPDNSGRKSHTFSMPTEATKKDLAKQFLKSSREHRENRCDQCGRRLKLQPGAILFSIGKMPRFYTCRSCGYENPSLWEKVADELIAAGFTIPGIEENVTDLGACLGCGVELQVSRDFTKVFCNVCGRTWDRFEFEDLMGGPISPMLAGKNALKFDSSKNAIALDELLEENDHESGNPYLVLSLKEKDSFESIPLGKGLLASFKAGLNEGKASKHGEPKSRDAFFLALYDDCTTFYENRNGVFSFNECKFDQIFSAMSDELELPFSQEIFTSKALNEYFDLLDRLKVIHQANLTPYAKELFGTALKKADVQGQSNNKPSLADELKKLADLKSEGLLTDEEFAAAKSALLNK